MSSRLFTRRFAVVQGQHGKQCGKANSGSDHMGISCLSGLLARHTGCGLSGGIRANALACVGVAFPELFALHEWQHRHISDCTL